MTPLQPACACAGPWPAGIALLALPLVRALPRRRRASLLQTVRMLPRRSKFGAAAPSALVVAGLTAAPYLHAPRDMPLIARQDECGCAAPVLYVLLPRPSCYRQASASARSSAYSCKGPRRRGSHDRVHLVRPLGEVPSMPDPGPCEGVRRPAAAGCARGGEGAAPQPGRFIDPQIAGRRNGGGGGGRPGGAKARAPDRSGKGVLPGQGRPRGQHHERLRAVARRRRQEDPGDAVLPEGGAQVPL